MDKDDSFVLVQFKDVNSVEMTKLAMPNISPMQLLALAGYFEYKAKSIIQAQEVQMMMEQERLEQEKPKIAVPDTVLPRK
jgi:hypothetical protein